MIAKAFQSRTSNRIISDILPDVHLSITECSYFIRVKNSRKDSKHDWITTHGGCCRSRCSCRRWCGRLWTYFKILIKNDQSNFNNGSFLFEHSTSKILIWWQMNNDIPSVVVVVVGAELNSNSQALNIYLIWSNRNFMLE